MTVNDKPLEVIEPGFAADVKKVWIVAREVESLAPGAEVVLGVGDSTYPQPLTHAPVADYQVMAFLNVDRNAAYTPSTDVDIRSRVLKVPGLNPSAAPAIELRLSERARRGPPIAQWCRAAGVRQPRALRVLGRPMAMRGVVVLPPEYREDEATVSNGLLDSRLWRHSAESRGVCRHDPQGHGRGQTAPDDLGAAGPSCPGGTHEFVNSLNNGPWGTHSPAS